MWQVSKAENQAYSKVTNYHDQAVSVPNTTGCKRQCIQPQNPLEAHIISSQSRKGGLTPEAQKVANRMVADGRLRVGSHRAHCADDSEKPMRIGLRRPQACRAGRTRPAGRAGRNRPAGSAGALVAGCRSGRERNRRELRLLDHRTERGALASCIGLPALGRRLKAERGCGSTSSGAAGPGRRGRGDLHSHGSATACLLQRLLLLLRHRRGVKSADTTCFIGSAECSLFLVDNVRSLLTVRMGRLG